MGKGKALIGGTERSEEIVYPPDWPCVRCKRPFSEHVKIGTPGQQMGGEQTATYNWCFTADNPKAANSWDFKPVDNLTYVEMKANGKISI